MDRPHREATRTRRAGAGRKKGSGKYFEETCVARIPKSVAANVDFYYSLPDMLIDLAVLWETRFSGSVRGDVSKACATDLRQLVDMLRRSTV